ncbi:MAG: hypothetical protein JNJ94_02600 [Chlorobi bacterium]|nr:hypothetical protein [Chlorobiota bacterium]
MDLGYHGLQNEYVKIIIPKKKPRNGRLPSEQKEKGRAIASSRIAVEHAIGLCKCYRCVSQTHRNHRAGFEDALMLM